MQLLAANGGARFSMQGFGELVHHARNDETLQFDLATRADLPRRSSTTCRACSPTSCVTPCARWASTRPTRSPRPCSRRCICACPRPSTSATARRARFRAVIRDITAGVSSIDRELQPLARADRAYDIATIVSELANVDHATAMKAITGQNEEPMVVLVPLARRELGHVRGGAAAARQAQPPQLCQEPDAGAGLSEMDRSTARRVLRFLQIRRSSDIKAA